MKFPNIGFFLYICAVILIITLMGLTNHQILAFLNIKGLGLKTGFTLAEYAITNDSIYPQELSLDNIVEIKYLNRIIEFIVVEFEGSKALKVSKAVNSSLLIGDIVFVHHLKVGENLVADKVFRNGLLGNYKTNGELSSVEVNP